MGAQASRQLLEAAACGNIQALQRALRSADVNAADQVPCKRIHPSAFFLQVGLLILVFPSQDGWSAVHFGAWAEGGQAVVAALLGAGANADARDKVRRQPCTATALQSAPCLHAASSEASCLSPRPSCAMHMTPHSHTMQPLISSCLWSGWTNPTALGGPARPHRGGEITVQPWRACERTRRRCHGAPAQGHRASPFWGRGGADRLRR